MNELFVLNDRGEIEINKPWIMTILEFKDLWSRVEKCEGDHDGRKKMVNMQRFLYLYHSIDYRSRLENLSPGEREAEAIRHSKIDVKLLDKDDPIMDAARKRYQQFIEDNDVYQMFVNVRHAWRQTSEYFSNVDYTKKDDKGKMLYEPKVVMGMIKDLDGLWEGIDALWDRVKKQAQDAQAWRGDISVGIRENPHSSEIPAV